MKVTFILLVFCILLSACSTVRPIQGQVIQPDQVEVGIQDSKEITKETNDDSLTKIQIEETVRVGAQGGELYTNTDLAQVIPDKVEKKLRIGINLGPGLNRVINYVSVLKVIERHNLAPVVVTGTGMGAIVAAMYADGMTPEMIEWNFYKYFKENKIYKPYDRDWLNHVDQVLLSKFKNSKIEETKKKFFITLYDRTQKKAYYFDRGNIRDLLLKGLQLVGSTTDSSEQKYIAVFEKEVFNARLLSQMGADFTLGVDSLGTKFDFDHPNEFLVGIYGRSSGRIQKEKASFDYVITLPLAKMNLDSNKEVPLSMKRTYEFMGKEVALIKNKIQRKLEAQ